MPNPYDRTTHDGKTVDWLTKAALLEMELRLGYRLTVVQGSYHQGVGASAGTHDGGGAVDLAPYDWADKVRVGRAVGFAMWHRPTIPGVWSEHCHGILTGNTHASPSAKNQVTSYFNGRNGLANNATDPTPRPKPLPTYQWPGSDAAIALEKKAAAVLDKKAPTPVVKKPNTTTQFMSTGPLRVDGIDLSKWNTVTATGLAAARKAGVRWVYHKATEGATFRDGSYTTRRALTKAVGLPFGAYHFARPDANGADALTEAKFFLATAAPRAGDMRPMLDLEDRGGLTQAQLTKWVGVFVGEVKRQTGVLPIVYTPFNLDNDFSCMLWVARYHPGNVAPVIPKPWKFARIRQFSNGQVGNPRTVAGVGPVDLNTMDLDPDQSMSWYLIPGAVAPKPKPPAPKPVGPKRLAPLVVPVDPTVLTLSVVVANIKCNPEMSTPDVEADVAAIKGLPTPGASPAWFGSEIEIPRYTKAWTDQLACLTLCATGECPVTVRAIHWRVLGSAVHVLHGGMAGVSPRRVLSVVRATHVDHPDVKVAFVAKHMVSGAFSNSYPATKAWRRARWDEDFSKTQTALKALVDDGYTVVVGGDTNRSPMPDYLPGQIHLTSNGVQHLVVVPPTGTTVRVLGAKATSAGDLHTDHPAIVATFTITPTP